MRKSKKYFIVIGILLLVIFICFSYPKGGSFSSLIFKVIGKEPIIEIKVIKTDGSYKYIEDVEIIHDLTTNLAKLEIIEYRKDMPKGYENKYDISFYCNEKYHIMPLGISLYDSGYFTVFTDKPSSIKYKTYKITDDLDFDYIKGLLSHISYIDE